MKEFEFTLKFSLPDSTQDPQDYIDALSESGCDDAIIGIGHKGRVALQFTREAGDGFTAVVSAIRDVKSAIPDAKLVESSPDLVGLTDIAQLIGVSRQYLRKLETTKANFPQPAHSGKASIWHLSHFLKWYEEAQNKPVDGSIQEIASANMLINIGKEWVRLDDNARTKISSLMPVDERIQLVEEIWDSIADKPEAVDIPDWHKQELEKRLELYRNNPGDVSTWQEVKEKLLG